MAKKKSADKTRTAAKQIKKKRPRPHRAPVAANAPKIKASSPAAEESEETGEGLFPIVGIGASAGGLEAFTEMLQSLPCDTGMAFVFVQHLDPKHVSLLTELLQRQSRMPVREATHRLKVEPNQIYVIPRNTHMNLVRGVLTLTPRVSAPSPHMPIDPFLRSLAADQKSKAIGVILSGNASDGALGMIAIKAAGGITFAQSSESAKHDGMPRSAVAAGCVDFVLSPKEIAKELDHLGRHPYITPRKATGLAEALQDTPEALGSILSLLRQGTGVDFAYYKTTTIRRRILRRMALRRLDGLDPYIAMLRSDNAELHALYEDILINVTEFFRDPEVFKTLKKVVFPKIMPDRGKGSVRIWVPGCSTGEEVYSIAIALLEFLEGRSHEVSIQIFATDISDIALDKARSGVYSPSSIQGISPERVRRFFTKVDSSFQISKRIREMCVFAKQNLVKDPPFSKLDLVSCRNVLIYLGPLLQKRVIPMFHYALKPSGFLLLGSSEAIGSFPELFELADKKSKIYTRHAGSRRHAPQFLLEEQHALDARDVNRQVEDWTETELLREADRIILGKYAPVGVVVDDDLNIVQFRGRTTAFLEPSPGMASLNLLKMAREGMLVELRKTVQAARRENAPVKAQRLRMRRDSGFIDLNVEVIPFKKVSGRDRRYLVLFEETPPENKLAPGHKTKTRYKASALEKNNVELRRELEATKEYLQSIIEEHESSNEELRSANEEIQSSNEELQSTNEELETAKEELQSTNEELNTVNEELQTRNLQLSQAGNDVLNLLSSVNIPIVMLGSDLRIRRFTPVCQRLLNLIPADVGRPISDINLNLDMPRLDHLALEVIESLSPKVIDVKDLSGRSYSLRMRPYRTEDDKIDGVVIVLMDIDPERLSADAMAERTIARPSRSTSEMDPSSDELRAFSAGLLLAQERERRNLSLELHDDFAQRLALLEVGVDALEHTARTPAQVSERLGSFRKQIASLSKDLHRIAYRLHPSALEDLGLVAALDSYIRDFSTREQIDVKFQKSLTTEAVGPDVALCLYRALQESLRNISKHSGTHQAQVSLIGTDNNIQLVVKDGGTGFHREPELNKGGLGLRSMEERARLLGGTFQIHSEVGRGTEIIVSVPRQKPEKGE